MAKIDPQILAHLEWIGFVRPTGLVVSAPALVRAGAILDRRDAEGQRLLRECADEREFNSKDGPIPYLPDFQSFASMVLGWRFSPKGYVGMDESPIPDDLKVPLPDYGETLRPDFAVREMDPPESGLEWQLLVRELKTGQEFDNTVRGKGRLEASPHSRMERLLRQTQVPAGLLFNGHSIRIVSAPRGESSGWADFNVADMVQTAGRPICTALRLLLSEQRLLAMPRAQRLAALLEDSRKFQNEVSERLAEQVLHALYELLRGFQSAHDASKSELLRQPLQEHPDEVYRALLTVILRLVFVLYAEERDMLPEGETFLRNYSLAGLYDRLREDAALYPDTMEQRFGAWAQLLVLFRMIFDGADSDTVHLPRRHGVLFDPDRFPFLEGRASDGARQIHERVEPPLVPDGTIYRALEKLLVLDSERISYRALDVEQIGSVYETMMGFRLETATGLTVAIKATKKHGAPTAIDLEALLREPSAKREKWVTERTDRKLSDRVKKATKEATTLEDLHSALLPVIDLAASPDLVPKSAIVLQPSEERRRSGSHYTPRELTEPIVRTALEPILDRLREGQSLIPRPEQILDLKVCDPAMGSGAFLVETCRQLADALIEAWHAHDNMPEFPPDEDEVIFARRLVAQRCLYGVDRNTVAVDLAKVSLWLVTLAEEHALTFVDHALRHGDSLVGLSQGQIKAFHWDSDAPQFQAGFETMGVREHLSKAGELRERIRSADETVSDWELRDMWEEVQSELDKVCLFGDLAVAAFFEEENTKNRREKRSEYAADIVNGQTEQHIDRLKEWREAEKPLVPFHWEIEFPEVFWRDNGGFDAFVGNPPFAGKNTMANANTAHYLAWLKEIHEESHGNSDLVAHFFRRAFNLLRSHGTLGLVATNTIRQGDTRSTGLRWICKHGGTLYDVVRRWKWPGGVAVIVSLIHIGKSWEHLSCRLDGKTVQKITAFLFDRGNDDDPARLVVNTGKSYVGSYILGMGFTFDDFDSKGVATPLDEMRQLVAKDPHNSERIFGLIGGSDINSHPTQASSRFVINFGDMTEEEARQWPDLFEIVERKVRPERMKQNRESRKRYWWRFAEHTPTLYKALGGVERVLVGSMVTPHLALAFHSTDVVFSHAVNVFMLDQDSAFAVLQSRVHDVWARLLSSSAMDLMRYTRSDCFETFPFPADWQSHEALTQSGQQYYEYRSELMVRKNLGLTAVYNRFHNSEEQDPEIQKLRDLHYEMDRVVLDAYGWGGIAADCQFLLDYEIDEEEWSPRKRKPYRYRWPDDVRDEVLARLLELNAERAREETRSGLSAKKSNAKKKCVEKKTVKQGRAGQKELF